MTIAPLFLVLSTAYLQESAAPTPALRGLDPVELVAGRELAGDPEHMEDRNGFRYAFVSEENAEEFEAQPGNYEIQLGGGCGSMGPLSGQGDPERFAVHAGRIYIFASDACRDSFLAAPEKYVEPEEFPLDAERDAERARGRELLAQVLAALGGAERIDAIGRLRTANAATRQSGDKSCAWREERTYDFAASGADASPGPGVRLRTTSWDDRVWREELRATLRSGAEGEVPSTMGWAARHEFELEMSRELLFLLRQRANTHGLSVWSAGPEDAPESGNGRTLEKLVVFWNGRNTVLHVAPESGRVERMSWYGRLTSGPNGQVVVDFADFEPVAGLVLPRSREVHFDGRRLDHLSGRLATLELDVGPGARQER